MDAQEKVDKLLATIEQLIAQRDELQDAVTAERSIIDEMVNSGVEFEDERLGHTSMQLSKGLLFDAEGWLKINTKGEDQHGRYNTH